MPEWTALERKGASSPERVNFALGLVAILALGLGFWQVGTLIRLPFIPSVSPPLQEAASSLEAPEAAEVEALKDKDTDRDGLSDYDEIYLYQTSAYLGDTDSDGYDDKTEVSTSNDPNCPTGQTCDASSATVPGSTTTPAANSTSLSAAELRVLLRQNGLSDEMLSRYDDAALIKLYQEVAVESGVGEAGSSSPTPEQREALGRLSGAELRSVLEAAGADPELLQGLDDESLKAVVTQMLNSAE